MSPSAAARLHFAPELVVVDLVGAAVRALTLALAREHPTLDDMPSEGAPPTLRRARALVRAARRLAAELGRYRDAIDHSLDAVVDTALDGPF